MRFSRQTGGSGPPVAAAKSRRPRHASPPSCAGALGPARLCEGGTREQGTWRVAGGDGGGHVHALAKRSEGARRSFEGHDSPAKTREEHHASYLLGKSRPHWSLCAIKKDHSRRPLLSTCPYLNSGDLRVSSETFVSLYQVQVLCDLPRSTVSLIGNSRVPVDCHSTLIYTVRSTTVYRGLPRRG